MNIKLGRFENKCQLIINNSYIIENLYFEFQNSQENQIHLCEECMLSAGITISSKIINK